jgi:MFS family permease
MDRWGRKTAMLTTAIVSLIGAIGLTAAQNIGMFIAFRFFTGAGSFAFLAVSKLRTLCCSSSSWLMNLAPVYTSELAPPAYRGFFGGMVGVMLGLGYASASFFGLAFSFQASGSVSWRVPLGLGIFWPLLIVCILPFIPESPRYLLMTDKHDEAWKVIEKLHGDPNDPENEVARSEFYQMHQQISFDRTVDSSWKHMFTKPSYRKRSIYAMAFTFFTQSTAVLVITNYVSAIKAPLFQRLTLSGTNILRRPWIRCPRPTDTSERPRFNCFPWEHSWSPPHGPARSTSTDSYRVYGSHSVSLH